MQMFSCKKRVLLGFHCYCYIYIIYDIWGIYDIWVIYSAYSVYLGV